MATTPTMRPAALPPPVLPPGAVAPAQQVAPGSSPQGEQVQQTYGRNNENLPEELQLCLRRLVATAVGESPEARRDEVQRVRQARDFWKGLQHEWWDEEESRWRLPFDLRGEDDTQDVEPRFMFVTNYFQAFGLSIIAVLSQDAPPVRLWPQSTQQEEDMATAKAGSDVIELVERNNKIGDMMIEEAFLMWTDGKVGAYVRYVVDGSRFGYHKEPDLGSRQVSLGEDGYKCPNPSCGAMVQADQWWGMCPECGGELDEANRMTPELLEVPTVQRMVNTPNGAEVIDLIGTLELKTPSYAKNQHDFGFLIWEFEAHKAKLKASYTHVAAKIGTSTQAEGEESHADRLARLRLTTSQENDNLVTFRRVWLRPWYYWNVEDQQKREDLFRLFPSGCYVAFAGDVYCESRDESMDDYWRVMHALPGDGQDRPAIGTSMISVQERINTLDNILIETAEFGIPPTYAISGVLDFDALPDTIIQPGTLYECSQPPSGRLSDSIYTPTPAQVSPDVTRETGRLAGPVAQFLTGAFPALFGGEMESNETASGYAMARDQALGRIGLVWRRMKQFHADIMLLAVDCFRKNRPDDVELPIFGPGGEFQSKWIRQADLKGNIFAYPESDEQYPTLWNQQRAVLMQLMESPDPMVQEILGHPENVTIIKRLVGLDELKIPGEDSRQKQYREIEQLLADGGAIPQVVPDQATGAPTQQMAPTILVDALFDDHEVEFEVCQAWANSDAGQAAKAENPGGFENVHAHAALHWAAWQQQVMAEAMQAATAAPSKKAEATT